MEFWQNIVLKWKQIQQFCLWALSSDPSGLVESGLYYNTTANRAALRDDTKTQFLAHLEDTYKNAGVVKQPTITKGAGSVTVGNDAIIRCYKTTDYSGIIQEVVNPTGGTFALTENTPLWLVYTYGVGYSVQTSITGPLSNTIPIYRFFNAFGVIHSSTQDEMGVGATEKILVKQTRTEYIKRVGDSGIELSTSALNVLVSGGLAYNGPILETILPFNSATNNLYRVVCDDGVWSQTTLHALTNTHYNPSTGLAALNSNKYCWAYVWRSIGNDVEALFQLGEQEYATEALAVADIGKMPSNIYGLYATHCVLVGYVLIKQGVTTTQYFSAWGRPTVAGAPVYHNTLAGIDAGDPGTAYFGHVKLIDNSRMNAAGAANGYALLGADGKLPSGQLPSYVDDVLEYAAKANFPATGENGKIYVDLTTNLTWRWSGTTYVEISPSLALGETSTTAYRGDRGKTAYDHSQLTASNPHGTTAAQIASTATGDVSATTVQAAIAELASEKLAATTAASTYATIASVPSVDSVPTDGSMNAVSSGGVFDAIASLQPKHSTGASSDGGNAGWTNNITVSIPKTTQYTDRQSIFNVRCYGGTSSDYQWTARVMLSIKIQGYTPSYKLVILDGDNYIGRVYGRYDQDANRHYFTPEFYICHYGYTEVELESGDLPETFDATYVPSVQSYSVAATVYDNYLESNTGTCGGVKLKDDGSADKSGYRGLSVGGAKRLVLMSKIAEGYCGLHNESDGKWLVLSQPDGTLYTGYTPPISSDGDHIPTTAWVKDVAQPLDSTLTALSRLSSGIPLLTGDSEATSINRATLVESLRANSVISGGGVLTVSPTFSVKWSSKFIVLSNGRGSHFSTDGFFDILVPPIGTEITGLGTSNKKVSATGIELGAWEALYYILPIGSGYQSNNENFRLILYTYSTEIPENWILIALRNSVTESVQFAGGSCLYAGETKTDNWQKQINGKAPTSHSSTDATYGVADADHYGHAMASSAAPLMNGTASAGTDNGKYARERHVHPNDTSKDTYPKNYAGAITTSQTINPADGNMYFISGSGLTITLSNTPGTPTTAYLTYKVSCGYSQHAIQFYDFGGTLTILKTRPFTGSEENSTIVARRILNGWIVSGY